jgi:hypothetical protein
MRFKAEVGESNTGLFRFPLNSSAKSSGFSVCPSGLTASRSKPNEQLVPYRASVHHQYPPAVGRLVE